MWLREFISRILDLELNYVLDVHFVFYVMYHLCYLCIPPLRLEMLKRMSTCTSDYHGIGERGDLISIIGIKVVGEEDLISII